MEAKVTKEKAKGLAPSITGRFIGVVFGYMAIGLLITALAAFLFAFGIAYAAANDSSDAVVYVALFGPIAALVAAYTVTIVNSIYSLKTGKAPWVGYIFYAIFTGIGLSIFLIIGVSFETVGMAFLIAAASFGAMFLVGYFSKANLGPLAIIAIGVLVAALLISSFYGIIFLVSPSSLTASYILVSSLLVVYCLLMAAIEASRIGKIAEKGVGNNNLALYCAFSMYSDFIAIFVRILYILIIAASRKD